MPLDDLRRYLAKHPNDVVHTNPTLFEQLMGDCLKLAYPGAQVMHVGCVGDKGTDLILVTDCGDHYLVQVKRRESLSLHEGVLVVRELNGVLFREGKVKGMVITTADRFTKGAFQEVEDVQRRHAIYEMALVAMPHVVEMLNLPRLDPYEPWAQVLDNILPRKHKETTCEQGGGILHR